VAKLVMIFFAAVALIQIVKPLGWPGLRQRRDAWKLVMAAFAVMIVLIALRPEPHTPGTEPSPAGEPRNNAQ
jgi:hypothetical protein